MSGGRGFIARGFISWIVFLLSSSVSRVFQPFELLLVLLLLSKHISVVTGSLSQLLDHLLLWCADDLNGHFVIAFTVRSNDFLAFLGPFILQLCLFSSDDRGIHFQDFLLGRLL
jgi:hypothetical protein